MYICCKHCKHTGSFKHEIGHFCIKHQKDILYNNKDAIDFMFNCKDCELEIGTLLKIARYMKTISFEVIFDEYFETRNDIGVYIQDKDKWEKGMLEGKVTEGLNSYDITNDNVIGYNVLFNNFPVFYTENKDEIRFIQKALGIDLK